MREMIFDGASKGVTDGLEFAEGETGDAYEPSR